VFVRARNRKEVKMAVAFMQEWRNPTPGTGNYDAIRERLDVDNNPPEGLIAHTAGLDGAGVFRIFDVWVSREHAQRFNEQRVMPIVNELSSQRGVDLLPPDTMDTYELHDFIQREQGVTAR
jgi:hypothetical protein